MNRKQIGFLAITLSAFVLFFGHLDEANAWDSKKSASLADRAGGYGLQRDQTYRFKENLSFGLPVCNCSYCSKSSGFGPRRPPKLGASAFHRAVDIAAPKGTPVIAMESGLVSIRSNSRTHGYGLQLRIKHNETFESRYAHLNQFVKISGWVEKNELIGYSGSTGVATGPHIHLEILRNGEKVNPEKYTTTERQFLTVNKCVPVEIPTRRNTPRRRAPESGRGIDG